MIWGWSRGWSANRIATAIKISERVIWNYKARVVRSPAVVFYQLSLYIQMDAHKFQCRICGEIRTTRTKVMRHILAHFLPDEIARTAALSVVERPL